MVLSGRTEAVPECEHYDSPESIHFPCGTDRPALSRCVAGAGAFRCAIAVYTRLVICDSTWFQYIGFFADHQSAQRIRLNHNNERNPDIMAMMAAVAVKSAVISFTFFSRTSLEFNFL